MSRYLARTDTNPPFIEPLPKGTKRTEGQNFREAKKDVVEYCRAARDSWALAAKLARRLSPKALKIEDVVDDAEDEEDDEPDAAE